MSDEISSFGPAQELRTHAPVRFAKLGPSEEGRYDGPSLIDLLKNVLTPTKALPGTITLDPSSPSFNLNRDTRHEAIHSLLMNAPKDINPALVAPDIYPQIARQLMQSRQMQVPNHEVAAYMGAYDPKQTGVPQDWRDEYIGKLQSALGKINPKLAKTFAELSK